MAYKNREDQQAYGKQHYLDNKEEYQKRSKISNLKARQRNQEYVKELKKKPCTDCGGIFPPECMDFDHLDNKIDSVARLQRQSVSLKRIQEEIDKCELVCANCHRIRTRKRWHGEVV